MAWGDQNVKILDFFKVDCTVSCPCFTLWRSITVTMSHTDSSHCSRKWRCCRRGYYSSHANLHVAQPPTVINYNLIRSLRLKGTLHYRFNYKPRCRVSPHERRKLITDPEIDLRIQCSLRDGTLVITLFRHLSARPKANPCTGAQETCHSVFVMLIRRQRERSTCQTVVFRANTHVDDWWRRRWWCYYPSECASDASQNSQHRCVK